MVVLAPALARGWLQRCDCALRPLALDKSMHGPRSVPRLRDLGAQFGGTKGVWQLFGVVLLRGARNEKNRSRPGRQPNEILVHKKILVHGKVYYSSDPFVKRIFV